MHIYFIQADELRLIKIGFATKIERRFRDLCHSSPDRLHALGVMIVRENGLAIEAELHARFSEHRVHGEWFLPDAAITNYIKRYAVTAGDVLARLNGVLAFPTMPRGRPTREMMRRRELAGLEKWS